MQSTDSFRAMNTDVDALIESAQSPIEAFLNIRLLFERQEQRFSRFRPSSLLSRLNSGEAVNDAQFAAACRLGLQAHEFTGGLFNPMVLPALRDAGYALSFELVDGGAPTRQRVPDPGLALVLRGDEVQLKEGQLDLGGIVKGWTVDLAVGAFEPAYANLLVNAGGDLRCAGSEDGRDGWLLSVEGRKGACIWEGDMHGALATSTTRRRRWTTSSGAGAHHLIDPRTGLPAESSFEQVSVWSEYTWVAECWAKAILIGGEAGAARAGRAGLSFVTVSVAGEVGRPGATPPSVAPSRT